MKKYSTIYNLPVKHIMIRLLQVSRAIFCGIGMRRQFIHSYHKFIHPLIIIFGILFFNSSVFSQRVEYKVKYFDEYQYHLGMGINDNGTVVGLYTHEPGIAFKWDNGSWTYLPDLLDGWGSIARGINNDSIIVGSAAIDWYLAYSIVGTPVCWINGQIKNLYPDRPYGGYGHARRVNSRGTILGYVACFDTNSGGYLIVQYYKPFIFKGVINIANYNADPGALNDSDYVVGSYYFNYTGPLGYTFPYISQGIGMPNFLAVPESLGGATDINNHNQVVGWAKVQGVDFAYLWDKWNQDSSSHDTAIQLSEYPSRAIGINESGTIIGTVTIEGQSHYARWENGNLALFDTLVDVDPWSFGGIIDINARGDILFAGAVLIPEAIYDPKEGETWIAGEKDTIRWTNAWQDQRLVIEFSQDSGKNYQVIAADIAGRLCQYEWDVPDTIISTKCLLRLRDNLSRAVLVVSDLFRIKPYILTRIDRNGDFDPYHIETEKWGFGNDSASVWPEWWFSRFDYKGTDPYTNLRYGLGGQGDSVFHFAKSYDHPDWISFVRTFGTDICYRNTGLGIYSPIALAYWKAVKGKWGGSCFGMAISNALAFEHLPPFKNKYTDFPEFASAAMVLPDTIVIATINELFTHQYGNPHQSISNTWGLRRSPTETIRDLKEMFKKDSVVQALSMFNNGVGGGGHTILAYKMERVTKESPVWNVHVYDNSYPEEPDAIIQVDTSANGGNGSWSPLYAWQGWGGNRWFFIEDTALGYLVTPAIPPSQPGLRKRTFNMSGDALYLYSTMEAAVSIRDAEGNLTGFISNQIENGIPGATPIVVKNGRKMAPIGYSLPTAEYFMELGNFLGPDVHLTIFGGDKIYGFSRKDGDIGQRDKLYALQSPEGEGMLVVVNPDSSSKTITLSNIINEYVDEVSYTIRSVDLHQNDSLLLYNEEYNLLKLTNYGVSKSYSLELNIVNVSSLKQFLAKEVPLSANTTHKIIPDWGDPVNNPVTILVDEGSDGSIEDTLLLQNDLTAMHNHGTLIPDEYKLYQNYPNPFNPLCNIQYDIPKASFVTLKVYNVLGQEVSTLVNEKREAGSYEVGFDGSTLMSGMYFYRLDAVSLQDPGKPFTKVKKMILLK